MSKLAKLSMLIIAVAATTASTPFVPPVQPVVALTSLAIIEGGTVSTLPKSVKSGSGRIVVLRGRADKAKVAKPAKKPAATTTTARSRQQEAPREAARSCACGSGGGAGADVVDLRNTENALKVMMLGPDGLTRTRYVPASPHAAVRHDHDA